MNVLINLCRFIANRLALLTLLGAVMAYVYPPLFLVFKDSFLWFFAATMFAMGIVLDTGELQQTLRKPWQIGLGVMTQFTVMPLLGFGLALLSPLSAELKLGFIIVACAPGAMASNVMVYLAGGAVAFSVAMTTVATFLSPLLTPLLVELLGGELLHIPFWPMMETIILTVVLPLVAVCNAGAESRLKISRLSPITLPDSDTTVHCDMVPESRMQVRNHLREDFVMHSSSKGSSDAEKRFQPAARRVFFACRDGRHGHPALSRHSYVHVPRRYGRSRTISVLRDTRTSCPSSQEAGSR